MPRPEAEPGPVVAPFPSSAAERGSESSSGKELRHLPASELARVLRQAPPTLPASRVTGGIAPGDGFCRRATLGCARGCRGPGLLRRRAA